MLVLSFCSFSSVSFSFLSELRRFSSQALARASARVWYELHRFCRPTSYCLKYSFCGRQNTADDALRSGTEHKKSPALATCRRLQLPAPRDRTPCLWSLPHSHLHSWFAYCRQHKNHMGFHIPQRPELQQKLPEFRLRMQHVLKSLKPRLGCRKIWQALYAMSFFSIDHPDNTAYYCKVGTSILAENSRQDQHDLQKQQDR